MERFESVIENVSNMEVKGYEDPVECTRNLEIFAKSGEDQYLYKFTGPGVILPETYQKKMLNDFLKLETENAKLKVRSKGMSEDNALLLETNKKLKQENEKLENELGKWKREAADCLRTRDEVRREKNKEINELNQRLHQAEIDKRRLTYKVKELEEQKTMVIPGKMVDRISELEGLNEQLNERILELEELKTPTIENFADEEPSSRRDILKAAEKCVCGQREQDYGTPESNFQLIADLWNGYLGNNLSKEKRDFEKELGITHDHKELSVPWEISATDVAMMMALMKIARIRNGGGSGDSFVDLAGYAACGGEIWYGRKKQVPKGE